MKRLAAIACVGMLVGCATTVGDLKRLKVEVKELRGRRKAAQRSMGPMKRHHKALSSGSGGLGTVMMIGKSGLLDLAKASLPSSFKGKATHPKLRGSFKLHKPYDVRIQSGGKVALRMVLTGKDVGFAISGYANHIKKVKAALASGAVLDVTAHLSIDRKRNKLFVYLRCDSVHLKKYNDSTYRDAIRKGLNSRVFAARKGIALPANLRGAKPFLFTTANHVIIGKGG